MDQIQQPEELPINAGKEKLAHSSVRSPRCSGESKHHRRTQSYRQ